MNEPLDRDPIEPERSLAVFVLELAAAIAIAAGGAWIAQHYENRPRELPQPANGIHIIENAPPTLQAIDKVEWCWSAVDSEVEARIDASKPRTAPDGSTLVVLVFAGHNRARRTYLCRVLRDNWSTVVEPLTEEQVRKLVTP
jgi:hypothetical protein